MCQNSTIMRAQFPLYDQNIKGKRSEKYLVHESKGPILNWMVLLNELRWGESFSQFLNDRCQILSMVVLHKKRQENFSHIIFVSFRAKLI